MAGSKADDWEPEKSSYESIQRMVCYNLYIFDRHGTCLYYHEWLRPKPVRHGAGTPADDQKMMFGLFFSLKTFTAAMDPTTERQSQLGAPLRLGEACSFQSFRTNNYKLHFLESPSGLKFVLNTSPEVGDLREVLSYMYGSVFVDYVVKNPIFVPKQPFNNEHFTTAINKYIKSIGI